MASKRARERAAQCWCKPETGHIVMDPALAEAVAEAIDETIGEPWLGLATSAELIDELRARMEVNGTLHYKTVGGEECYNTAHEVGVF